MNFSTPYFTRYKTLPPFFTRLPDEALKIVIIIPCYDDDFIFETLDSLDTAEPIASKIEVIVIVNSGERTPLDLVERNRSIFNRLQQHAQTSYYKNFRLLPILTEGTVKKKAGVGFARKVGMDEAVRRFAAINHPCGLIVSLDADSLVSSDYLTVVEKASLKEETCFTFQFQHNYDPKLYSEEEITACKWYEIYLRYYRLALKTFGVPFAVHTIGSCFAIRAESYTKLGGMPSRQAGEDFYFLQKAIKMHPVCELKDMIVFPSPRISERVPFGTGASVRNIVAEKDYLVYNWKLFLLLKSFYDLFPVLESGDVVDRIPSEIIQFVGLKNFNDLLSECRKYSASSSSFLKRMYDKFDAFFIVKFLNSFDENSAFAPSDIEDVANALLNYYGLKPTKNLYEEIVRLDIQT